MTSTVFTDIDWDKDGKQIGTLNLPHSPDDDAWGVIPFPAASIKNGKRPRGGGHRRGSWRRV
jgi:hypothetical protein